MGYALANTLLDKQYIRSSERHILFWSVAFAFIVGSVGVYLSAIPMSLYLTEFGSKNLPLIFAVNALFVLIMGSGYSWFEPKFGLKQLTFGLFLFIAVVTLVFWFLLIEQNAPWVVFSLTVWSQVAYGVLTISMWSLFNRMYNVEQGKRLFGIIWASQCIGGIVAGATLLLILHFTNTEHLILLIGLLLCIALGPILLLVRNTAERDSERQDIEFSKETLSAVKDNKYVLKLLSLSALSAFITVIIEILFNSVALEHYRDKIALAGFLGIFFAVMASFDLVVGLSYHPLLNRVGLIRSLLLFPLTMLSLGCISLLSGFTSYHHALDLWLMAMLMLFSGVMRYSVTDMSLHLLLQPLPAALSTYVLTKTNRLVIPLATAIISITLLVMMHFFGIQIVGSVLAIVIFSLLSMLIIFTLKTDYLKVLNKVIANRYTLPANIQEFNRDSMPLLRQALDSLHTEAVIYALSCIETIDRNIFFRELHHCLKSPIEDIRHYVLDKIEQYQMHEFNSELLHLLHHDPSTLVRKKVIYLSAQLDVPNAKEQIAQLINSPTEGISRAAMIASWRNGDDATRQHIKEQMSAMLRDANEKIRRSAVKVIGEINPNLFPLLPLLSDPAKSVRREALRAVIKTAQADCFNELLNQLNLIQLRGELLTRFLQLDSALMPIIRNQFDNYPRANKIRLLKLMGLMSDESAVQFLEQIALTAQVSLEQTALRALAHKKIPEYTELHQQIEQKIQFELSLLEEQQHILELTPVMEVTQFFCDVVQRKINLTMERLLLFLTLYYGRDTMERIKIILLTGTNTEISHAIELIKGVLTPEHKKLIMPILTTVYSLDRKNAGNLESLSFRQVLKTQLAIADTEDLNILSCIATLYIIKTIGAEPFQHELQLLRDFDSAIIQETLAWI